MRADGKFHAFHRLPGEMITEMRAPRHIKPHVGRSQRRKLDAHRLQDRHPGGSAAEARPTRTAKGQKHCDRALSDGAVRGVKSQIKATIRYRLQADQAVTPLGFNAQSGQSRQPLPQQG